jgi:hypothetical protein
MPNMLRRLRARDNEVTPDGARHLVLIILDSLPYDSWIAADPKLMGRIRDVERRWSYASWTAPSHQVLAWKPNTRDGVMPVLNRHTPLNHDFDTYELMPTHNDVAAMFDRVGFDDGPSFYMLNVGETHYPYALPIDGLFEKHFGHGPIAHEKVLEVPYVEGLRP